MIKLKENNVELENYLKELCDMDCILCESKTNKFVIYKLHGIYVLFEITEIDDLYIKRAYHLKTSSDLIEIMSSIKAVDPLNKKEY